MKRSLFTTALLLFFAFGAYAQHVQGDINANVGLGIAPVFGVGKVKLPPVGVSVEYGIQDDISVGGYLGFSQYGEEFQGGKWRYSYIIIGPRASYHLSNLLKAPEELDLYAGVFLGYLVGTSRWDGDGPEIGKSKVGGLGWSGHLGARYAIQENLSVFGEVGYGISVLQIGVSFKL